jgi:hypothetical protein
VLGRRTPLNVRKTVIAVFHKVGPVDLSGTIFCQLPGEPLTGFLFSRHFSKRSAFCIAARAEPTSKGIGSAVSANERRIVVMENLDGWRQRLWHRIEIFGNAKRGKNSGASSTRGYRRSI